MTGEHTRKWSGSVVELDDWADFAKSLIKEMAEIKHKGPLLIRNFELETCDIDEDMRPVGDVDRLDIVLQTGTDRDRNSLMWNAPGHDFEHDREPSGQGPSDIIYAYMVELTDDGYKVHYTPGVFLESMDLTDGLFDRHGILVYDPAKLYRAAKNEHWFRGDPKDALLAIFKLK